MTSIAVAKLIIDGLLMCSLIFVAFRLLGKQQPGTIANLTKLKELESSLKEIVRDADDASNNLSQELLGRKRDLEKVLTEAEGAESRFNKSKKSIEDLISAAASAQTKLEQLIKKQAEQLAANEQLNTSRSHFTESVAPRLNKAVFPESPAYAMPSPKAHYTDSFNYEEMLEPPSFQREIKRPASLREQIEFEQTTFEEPRAAARQRPAIKEEISNTTSSQIRKDPRLGVLGALSKESNLY